MAYNAPSVCEVRNQFIDLRTGSNHRGTNLANALLREVCFVHRVKLGALSKIRVLVALCNEAKRSVRSKFCLTVV